MAQKAKFTKDFDYSPRFGVDIAYKKGSEELLPEGAYEAAKAAGVIEDASEPKAEEAKPAKSAGK
jgi:hypothetical protein